MKLSRVLICLALVTVFGAFAPARAAFVYEYTGPNYDSFYGTEFTSAMNVSGSITFSSAIGASHALTDPLPAITAWSWSNGLATWTNLSPYSPTIDVQLATDASGVIIAWDISSDSGRNTGSTLEYIFEADTIYAASTGGVDDGDKYSCDRLSGTRCDRTSLLASGSVVTAAGGPPGTWSSREVSGVPEPATLALFGLGLAGIGVMRRKKLAA